MPDTQSVIIGTFCIYLIAMLAIGYIAWKRTTACASDYFLGGRSLGPWPAALSAGASDMSGWLLLGLPGYAFAAGMEATWLALGLLMGSWLNWVVVARRLRAYSIVANDSLTLPAFFTNRFKDTSRSLQVISAFFILLFFLFYTSSGLVAGGKLFETVFGLDYQVAVVVGAVCIISYTLFGGFLAVSWTDLVQGLLMAAALLIVPVTVMQVEGGAVQVFTKVKAINPELLNPFTQRNGEAVSLVTIVSLLGWGLGYFGQPHILARFTAVRSEKDIPIARRIAVSWTGISMLGAFMVGLAGMIYVTGTMGAMLDDPETIFMVLVDALFHPAISGILLAAILAAIMSTADSQLLVSSSALAEDFYKAVFRKSASQKEVMYAGRIAVVLVALIALVLAMTPDSSVLGLVSYAWAGFGAAFGPALLMSLFWKRMTRNGALAGIVTGAVTVVVWKQLTGGLFDLYEIIPGIIIATISIIVVSLVSPEPEAEIITAFDRAAEGVQ